MSLKSPSRATQDRTDTANPTPDELLALLHDEYSMAILEEIRTEPKSARALTDICEASRPTIYRRLNRLEDAGLVESGMAYDADGHHRTVFEATVETVTVEVTDDGLSATVSTTQPVESLQPAVSGPTGQ